MRKKIIATAGAVGLLAGAAACGSTHIDNQPKAPQAQMQAWLDSADNVITNDTALNSTPTTCDEVQAEFGPIFDIPSPPYAADQWNAATASLHAAVNDCNTGNLDKVGTDSTNAVSHLNSFVSKVKKAYPTITGLTSSGGF